MDWDCHNGFGVRLRNVTELLLSIHIFDNFAFTSIYKYMHEKQPFLCSKLPWNLLILLILLTVSFTLLILPIAYFFSFFLESHHLIFIRVDVKILGEKKIQDPILPGKNIQDMGKRYSTFCIRGEQKDKIASQKKQLQTRRHLLAPCPALSLKSNSRSRTHSAILLTLPVHLSFC